MELEQQVRDILLEINPYAEFERETPLLEGSIIDSLGIMTFVTLLEERLEIVIVESDLTPETFASVSSIVRLLERYLEKDTSQLSLP